MFSIAAINDTESKSQWEPLAPTKEAQEFRLTQAYQEALLHLQAGEYLKAQNLLEAIIQDPLIASAELEHNASNGHMLQLRFLALKNLANVFAQQGRVYYEKAVQCYLQAVEIDEKDVVVWNQLGTLSCSLGSLNIARRAFEQGLKCSPNNWNCMEKLMEVLIAIGDEVACLAVSKLVLKKWPSHSRACLVKSVIEESPSVPFETRGIDKLEPKHISLCFPEKRKLADVEENENCSKKRKIEQVELHLREASWGALIDALLNVIKSKLPNNREHNNGSERAACCIDNKWLINGKVKFLVRNMEITKGNSRSHIFELQQCSSGGGRNNSMGTNALLECVSETFGDSCRDKGTGTVGICRDGPFIENSNDRTYTIKERDVSTDEEPPQERRSTRLRSRKCEREESDIEKVKEQGKLLRQMLDPYIVCEMIQINRSNATENSAMTNPAKIDKSTNLLDFDDSNVMKFLVENSSNHGVYHIGELLLEKVSVSNLLYQDSLYGLIEIDKLTRQWSKDRTTYSSLFLAELYSDLATSCTEESKVTDLINEATYHLCKVVESVAMGMPIYNFVSVKNSAVSKKFSKLMDSPKIGSDFEDRPGYKNMVDSCNSVSPTTTDSLTEADNSAVHLKKVSQKSGVSDSVSTLDWSFWVRFHWLCGRLWTFSGDREKGCKEFQSCVSILDSNQHVNGNGVSVLLPYCRVDKEISVERVRHELRLLEVETLLKRSSAKMLDNGKYSELIKLLSPVVLANNEKCFVQTWGANKVCAVDSSIELTALDMLILACEKANPKDLAVLLKCHKQRLELFCLAAGIVEIPAPGNMTEKASTLNNCNLTFELEQEEARKGHWNKMVADEVKSISRCASQIREEIEESETPASFDIPTALLGQVQCLLLTIMCHVVRALPSLKSSGVAGADPIEPLESSCFVDAAVSFCKLQHLDLSVSVKKQVELLVTVHELLADHGLCCAGKDCEGGEGTFLKLAIKHLLALEIKLKTSLNSANCPDSVKQISKHVIENAQLNNQFPKASTGNQCFDGHDCILIEDENNSVESNFCREKIVACTSGTEIENAEVIDERVKGCSDICKISCCDIEMINTGLGDGGDNLGDVETKKVDLGIDNALDQSFFCLYGLNLKCGLEASNEDDLAVHINTSLGDYQTKEQCADVFKYLLPYAKASSRAGLLKLKKVLRAIRKQFPQPTEEVLNRNAVDAFLEDPDFNEEKLRNLVMSGGNRNHIVNYAFGGIPDNVQVPLTERELEIYVTNLIRGKSIDPSTEPYSEVYGNLYYILAQVEEMSATDKFPSFVLTKEGEEFVQQNANLFKFDLLYNPLRFESWQKLANIYDEEVDLMLNDGSKHINVVEWKKQSNLTQRVDISRRRSRRCSLMSLALAKTPEQQSQVHELLALVYYDSLQNVVPLYDQRNYVPARDSAWTNFCQNSLKHFEKAFAYKPEWSHPFYLGKLSEKLGHPYEKALSYYSKAASMNPSAVDPVYRIHASRLKLLYTIGRDNSRAIKVVAGYCYQPSTKEKVSGLLEAACKDASQISVENEKSGLLTEAVKLDIQPEAPEPLVEAWRLLFDDCIAALEVCVEGELKHFHKARYMLAQGFYNRGEGNDMERAKEQLSFCFKSNRSIFTINMWEIDGVVRKGRRKAPGLGGAKKGLELGMPESSRKFITCIRKYILLYLVLCERTGDFYTLERAYSSIRMDKKFSPCLEDITPVALGKYIQALGRAISHAEFNGSGSSNSFEQLLEKMFNLFMDHGNLWSDLAGLSELRSPSSYEFSESTVYSFIHRYLHTLEIDNKVDILEGVNEKLRKRFKNPKLSNVHCANVCKHAALAWCRSILTNLVSITPLPSETHSTQPATQVAGSSTDYGLQMIVDLQTDELLNISYEDSKLQRMLGEKLHPLLSCMRNVPVKQVHSENKERAAAILRHAFNFYRESSSGTLPNGINLYAIPSRLHFQLSFPLNSNSEHASSVEILDLSTPRKLLLWAYTLVHGRYCNILAVVKHCEDTAKVNLMPSTTS